MSKGFGAVQRFVLAELERVGGPLTTAELAIGLNGPQPTSAQLESVRRAMRSLVRDGLLEQGYVEPTGPWSPYRWSLTPAVRIKRCPSTPARGSGGRAVVWPHAPLARTTLRGEAG